MILLYRGIGRIEFGQLEMGDAIEKHRAFQFWNYAGVIAREFADCRIRGGNGKI